HLVGITPVAADAYRCHDSPPRSNFDGCKGAVHAVSGWESPAYCVRGSLAFLLSRLWHARSSAAAPFSPSFPNPPSSLTPVACKRKGSIHEGLERTALFVLGRTISASSGKCCFHSHVLGTETRRRPVLA